MKTGVQYAHSREKRAFDVAMARALALPAHMGLLALRATELFRHDDFVFVQRRVGQFIVPAELDMLLERGDATLVDDWLKYVAPTKPGQVSTFALESHLGFDDSVDQQNERLQRDIEDVLNGSLAYDARLVVKTIHKALANKLQYGRIAHET